MSDSVRPHRWQPTRLPRPWDSPGKNTGVGCYFLLQCMKVKVKMKSLSRVRLLTTPWTAAHQAPLSMGFSRQENGVGCHCLLRGVMQLQAKKHQGLPATPRSWEEAREGCPWLPSVFRGSVVPPMPWIQTSNLQNCETGFCCLNSSVCSTLIWQSTETRTSTSLFGISKLCVVTFPPKPEKKKC